MCSCSMLVTNPMLLWDPSWIQVLLLFLNLVALICLATSRCCRRDHDNNESLPPKPKPPGAKLPEKRKAKKKEPTYAYQDIYTHDVVIDQRRWQLQKSIGTSTWKGNQGGLHTAAAEGDKDTLREWLRYMNKTQVSHFALEGLGHGNTPLHGHGNTPLHLAIYNGHGTIACCLIQAEPKAVYKTNYRGVSPHVVTEQVDIVDYMFRVIRQTKKFDRNPLVAHAHKILLAHAAIQARNLGLLKTILHELPSLMESSDKRGRNPLDYAAHKRFTVGTEVLPLSCLTSSQSTPR